MRRRNPYAGKWVLEVNPAGGHESLIYTFDERPRMETGGDSPYIRYTGKTNGEPLEVFVVRANATTWYVMREAEEPEGDTA